ncbi:hypothetical protein PV728_47465 [Streptomyces europaeiscabiei]|uniref:hypothetical protein n=1 Tax=Streptomyces europaeiscabiei TaxID=146819 RepID=UPI0029B87CD5|nr:hypothetical protein [Streptomyces europaeiscabiei]MDX3637689.1 hypothetical protein [Streptomyces europaeiscabiei]MDX3655520.1 hypothetical protein [Streptomyces europaeiscabiei]
MAAEVVMPVIVRIGETEAQWGTITFTADDGPVTEGKILRETAAFLREAADLMDGKAEGAEEST